MSAIGIKFVNIGFCTGYAYINQTDCSIPLTAYPIYEENLIFWYAK
jgi:hypothetical protein